MKERRSCSIIKDLRYIIELQKDILSRRAIPNDEVYAQLTQDKSAPANDFCQQAISQQAFTLPRVESVEVNKDPLYSQVVSKRQKHKQARNNNTRETSVTTSDKSVAKVDKHNDTSPVHAEPNDFRPNVADFKLVTHKRRFLNKNNSVGSTASPRKGKLVAAPRKIWLHVGRLSKDCSKEDSIAYLEENTSEHNFDCEKLSTRGENNSFKVGSSFDLLDKLNDPQFWPEGVQVRRFFLAPHRAPPKT